MDMKVPV
jgi:magnesium-transporting ATPase (P-type)